MSPGSPNKREGRRDITARRIRACSVWEAFERGEFPAARGSAGRLDRQWRGRRHSNGAAGGGAWNPQQAQRDRPGCRAPSRPVSALEGRDRPVARLRDDRAMGRREADRRLRASRCSAAGPPLEPHLLGLALQGIALAQRRRAPGLRRLAQELRDDVSGGAPGVSGAGKLEQPVEREEIRGSVG